MIEKKYYIITYGCQMNKNDSERIAGFLEKHNWKKSSVMKEANLIIINMCSVRQSAVDRVYGKIKQLTKIKKEKPKTKTLLTGCILKKDFEKFKKFFDYILSIKSLPKWTNFLKNEKYFYYPYPQEEKIDYLKIKPQYTNKISAFIPISIGCDNACTYCAVPYTRGKLICRDYKEIIKETKQLIKNGYKEIWLLGENVNNYKFKIKEEKKEKFIDFADLLKKINEIPGNFWIRFTSPNPADFSEKTIRTIAKLEKVTPYLNLPFQSGDNEILRKMNRKYTVEEYKKLVLKIRQAFKKYRQGLDKYVSISTDIIVGFPGETKKQFNNTLKLMKEIKFDMAYIAKYSPRPGTSAAKLEDNIPPKEKERREKILTDTLVKTALENNKKFIGNKVKVLIEEKKDNFLLGKTLHYKTVKIEENKEDLIGSFQKVKIKDAFLWGLKGSLIRENKVIVIVGPTASGKTDFSIKIAKKVNQLKKEIDKNGAEIISTDSRQVYKGMDIGSGKVTKSEMKGIPHHLLDVVSPKRKFTVSQYQKLATKAMKKIFKNKKVPILVGGTGFYIQAVIDGLVIPQVKPDWKLRKKLEKKSSQELFQELEKLDLQRAKNIDKFNKRRLIRALEIIKKTKKPVPTLKKERPDFDVLILGIKIDFKKLKKLIEKRLLKRIKKGMIKEVKNLKESGVSWKRLEEFGLEYRYISQYLQKKITKEEMIEKLKKEIENYAKRQMTWFKKDKRIHWIKNCKEAEKLVIDFLKD